MSILQTLMPKQTKKGSVTAMRAKLIEAREAGAEALEAREAVRARLRQLRDEREEVEILADAGEIPPAEAERTRARLQAAITEAEEKADHAEDQVRRWEAAVRIFTYRAAQVEGEERAAKGAEAEKELRAAVKRLSEALNVAVDANYAVRAASDKMVACGADTWGHTRRLAIREMMAEQLDNEGRRIPGATMHTAYTAWLDAARGLGYLK
jgi:ElaB/YqjD/DUF883 family membrane-anchored ribosome-binding protein